MVLECMIPAQYKSIRNYSYDLTVIKSVSGFKVLFLSFLCSFVCIILCISLCGIAEITDYKAYLVSAQILGMCTTKVFFVCLTQYNNSLIVKLLGRNYLSEFYLPL